ncbi:MAG: pyridoxal 5'-phosphate synthase glutaminase subunit PdxT [Actinobacteria bacterium]|uniref:glutaminase n=1 Tax=freshwater metagenome TaxID=449393 RepID=A0A6J6GXZ5_9ZZZZ|nr:pyridoxal 5'-phosphate synthase glutaminase subunit PdxT [Actinomycetota bacterium]MTA08426.1 pyridoxal 5'-phosphate synthase glutaminase subunit PdxT [Actinomycetota bacterium]
MKTIGVLAFQGDVREHLASVEAAGAKSIEVRTAAELASIDGLILPGGESTTISKLARIFELFDPLKSAIANGMPTFGTCAGLILLADRILDGIEGQETFGGLDVTVRRNAFGHQTESFETNLAFKGIEGPDMVAAFIRAPIIEQVGVEAEVLATLSTGAVVAVRQNSILGISFHPEVTDENRVHRFFIDSMVSA